MPHTRNIQCDCCCDFDFPTKSKVNHSKLPSNCPTTKYPMSPPFPEGRDFAIYSSIQILCPMKMPYQSLVTGTKAESYDLRAKQWKIIETRSYLKTSRSI